MKSYAGYITHEAYPHEVKITVLGKDEESAKDTIEKIVKSNFEGWKITNIVNIPNG